MRQILQSYRSGELWLAEVPAPALRAGGAIVRTAVSLVSAGTERSIMELARKSLLGKAQARPDLVRKVISKIKSEGLAQTIDKVFAKLDTPIPLGYSCAGTIVEAGEASHVKAGDRVACGGAGYASHADFNFIPNNLLVKLPDNVSFEDAAFTTVGAIAMQGVRQAQISLGERIVVIGLGLIGLLTVQILKAAGCRVLGTDPDAARCELARQLGADEAVSSELVKSAEKFTDGRGADAVVITAATQSNEPIEQAAEIARMKGRVVIVGVVGMNVPREPFYKKELDLRLSMSYGPGRYDPAYEEAGHDYPFGYVRWTEQRNMESFLDLVSAGKITPARLVTHHFDIADALAAYETIESNREPYLGIILQYQTDAEPLRHVELRDVHATESVGLGIIGAGSFAKGVLIPTLKKLDDIELVGICTATGASAAETAKKHDFAYATTDHRKILDDPNINTILIATRHDSHATLACAALRAGKHVFVEKPLCVKPAEIELYEQAIQEHPALCLMVGFNRRFSPHTATVRDAFAKRRSPLFITYRVNAGTLSRDSWVQNEQIGGGRIIGEMCHFIDFCEFVTHSTPIKVQAESIGSGEDSLAVTIRYEDGSLATIQYVSIGNTGLAKERIELFADGAAAVIDDFTTTTFHGIRRSPLKTKQDKGFTGEVSAFLNVVRNGGSPPIPFASMSRTTRVTFGIVESLRRGEVLPD